AACGPRCCNCCPACALAVSTDTTAPLRLRTGAGRRTPLESRQAVEHRAAARPRSLLSSANDQPVWITRGGRKQIADVSTGPAVAHMGDGGLLQSGRYLSHPLEWRTWVDHR